MGTGLAARLAFPADGRPAPPTGVAQLRGTELEVDCVPLQTRLHLLYYGEERPRALVLYVHGNSEDIYSADAFLARCHAEVFAGRYGLAAFDWPGYGRVAGRASERALVEATQQALYFCKRRFGLETRRIALWGRSIGSAGALAAAARNYVGPVLAESPLCSAAAAVGARLPRAVDGFCNREHVRHFKGAGLVIAAGDQDEVLDFRANALALFAAAAGAGAGAAPAFAEVPGAPGLLVARAPGAALFRVRGGHHNDLGRYFWPELRRVLEAAFCE